MQPRSTIYLVTVAFLLLGFILFFERHQRPSGTAPPLERALPGLRPQAVTRVQVRPAGQAEFVVERTNQVWMLTRPLLYPADGEAIESLLGGLTQLTTQARLTDADLRKHQRPDDEFGFTTPSFSVVLSQGEEVTQVLFGKLVEPLKDMVFVRVVGLEGVFLSDAALLQLVPRQEDAWRSTRLVELRDLGFDRIVVTNGPRTFELERAATGRWRLAPPVQARADHARVEALVAQLQAAVVGGFVAGAAAELPVMGLAPPELSLGFLRGTNALLQLSFGRALTNNPALLFARNSRWDATVLAPAEAVAGWRGALADFRDRRLVSLAPGQVEEVEFRRPAEFTLQRVTNEVWRVAGTNGFAADPALVFDFLGTLVGLEVTQVKDVVTPLDFPNYGLEPPAREILLRARFDNASPGDTNRLLVQLSFGTNQAGTIFARRADEKSVYGLRQRDVLRLAAAPWQLRDRRVWEFTEQDVARVIVAQGTNRFELLRSGPNQWQLPTNAPPGINDLALDEVIHQLGQCEALSWSARGTDVLPLLGFTAESPRVTVLLRDGARRMIEFGGRSPRGFLLAAAEVDGEPTVFEFPWSLWQDLATYLRVPPPPQP